MTTETETPDTKIEPKPPTEQPKPKAAEPVDDSAVKAAEAEKAKASEERKRAREIETAKAAAIAEYKATAEKEAKEAAELAKKSDAEKAAAAQSKLEAQLAEAKAESAANKLAADLALELIDQGLAPASAKAKDHIVAAFKAQIAAGLAPDAALKAVHADEAYLFKGQPVAEPAPKLPVKTAPESKGPTLVPAPAGGADEVNPGDITDPAKFKAAVAAKHGITIVG